MPVMVAPLPVVVPPVMSVLVPVPEIVSLLSIAPPAWSLPVPAPMPVAGLPVKLVTRGALLLDGPSEVAVPAVVPVIVPPCTTGAVLPGVGMPDMPGERVTGALAGGGGWAGVALTMRSPNCSSVVSRPRVSIGRSNGCTRRDGCCPRVPAGASRFCWRMALATSPAVMFSAPASAGRARRVL